MYMAADNEGVQGGAELPPAGDVAVGTFDLVSIQLYETCSLQVLEGPWALS